MLSCQIKCCFTLSYEKFGLNITNLLIIFQKNFATLSMIKSDTVKEQNFALLITDALVSE